MKRSSVVADHSTLGASSRKRSLEFRRRSTDAGITTDLVEKVEVPTAPPIGSSSSSNNLAHLKELSNGLVEAIKAANNVHETVKEWIEVNGLLEILLSDGEKLKTFVGLFAEEIKVPLKMARRGMAGSLLISLACTYGDVFSDIMMVAYYDEKNMTSAFRTSLGILIAALVAQGLVTWINTKHVKRTSERIRRVAFGVICLNPAIYAYGKWSGNAQEEGSTLSPAKLLGFTKFVGLIFESLPQLIVQLGFLLEASDSIQDDIRPIASIVFSVLAVGFIVSDLSVYGERAGMNESIRGPYQTYCVGVLPERRGGVFFFGHVLFVSGYFACAMISFTAAGRVFGGLLIFAFEFVELMCFLLLMRATGRARWVMGNSIGVGLLDIIRPEWLVTSVAPILLFRMEWLVGGGIWSRFIAWRLCATTAVVYSCSRSIEGDVMTIHTVALCCAIVGYSTMVIFASSSHRWTLFSTRMPMQSRIFSSPTFPLEYTFATCDECRLHFLAAAHPYYFSGERDPIRGWVLRLSPADGLLRGGTVPRGAHSLRGQSFATAFAIIKRKYRYFQDAEGDELISEHLDALLIEVEKIREEVQTVERSAESISSGAKGE